MRQNDVYRDNKESLLFLKKLKRKKQFDDIYFVDSISFEIIDLTHNGIPRNIGKIRQLGVDFALKNHQGSNENIVIGTFDADSIPPRQYFEEIAFAFAQPTVNAASFAIEFRIPRGSSPQIHASHFKARALYGFHDLRKAVKNNPPPGGSPRIVVRGSLLEKIGGFAPIDDGEDFDLLKRLADAGDLNISGFFLFLLPIELAKMATMHLLGLSNCIKISFYHHRQRLLLLMNSHI